MTELEMFIMIGSLVSTLILGLLYTSNVRAIRKSVHEHDLENKKKIIPLVCYAYKGINIIAALTKELKCVSNNIADEYTQLKIENIALAATVDAIITKDEIEKLLNGSQEIWNKETYREQFPFNEVDAND